MAKKTGLGKGLGALIPDSFADSIDESTHKLQNIDINLITPNVLQPRKVFEDEALVALSKSIARNGIIQPLILRRLKTGYEIIAGERRWRAAKLIQLKSVPALIMDPDEQKLYELALVENIQRVDLNAAEEAKAYSALIEKFNLTQESVSIMIGKSRAHITNTLRLLQLDPKVLDMVNEDRLSAGHARCLIKLNPSKQIEWALKIISNDLSVRQVEKMIKKPQKSEVVSKKVNTDIFYIQQREFLEDKLGTKVEITKNSGHSKITIDFYSDEDLERICALFK